MRLRTLWLALLFPLAACSSSRTKAEVPPESALRFTYHAALAHVPEGASEVRLGVVVPEQQGRLRALSLYGLVGNAPFELALPDTKKGELTREHVRVSWERQAGERDGAREIVLATRGKPLEVGVRLAAANRETDAKALAAELAGRTWAEIDRSPAPPVTSCERTR